MEHPIKWMILGYPDLWKPPCLSENWSESTTVDAIRENMMNKHGIWGGMLF